MLYWVIKVNIPTNLPRQTNPLSPASKIPYYSQVNGARAKVFALARRFFPGDVEQWIPARRAQLRYYNITKTNIKLNFENFKNLIILNFLQTFDLY